MASAISIYSRGRFSINYYCCSRNPGELKTNKRMTTETDSLGSLYTFLPLPTRTRLSKLVRAAHSTSAATWHTPDVPYTHQGSRAVCGPELGGGGGWTRAGRPPASHCGGQPAAGSRQPAVPSPQPRKTKGRRHRGPGATSGVRAGRSGQMLAARAGGPERPVFSRSAAPGALPGTSVRPPRGGALERIKSCSWNPWAAGPQKAAA